MTKKIDDGGLAFQAFRQHPLGRINTIDNDHVEAAKRAYLIADAMLAARKAGDA